MFISPIAPASPAPRSIHLHLHFPTSLILPSSCTDSLTQARSSWEGACKGFLSSQDPTLLLIHSCPEHKAQDCSTDSQTNTDPSACLPCRTMRIQPKGSWLMRNGSCMSTAGTAITEPSPSPALWNFLEQIYLWIQVTALRLLCKAFL